MGYETDRYTEEQVQEFETAIKPVCEWLQKNGHPHMKIIVLPTYAEIVEGTTGVNVDYFAKGAY